MNCCGYIWSLKIDQPQDCFDAFRFSFRDTRKTHWRYCGAIFHHGEEENQKAFLNAIKVLTEENIAPNFIFEPVIEWVKSEMDSFQTEASACKLLSEGVAAIFGPGNSHTRDIVTSITSKYGIPHIMYTFQRVDDPPLPFTTINVYPDSMKISEALSSLLDAMNWKEFTAMYETDDGLSRLHKLLMKHGPKDLPITVRQLKPSYDIKTNEPNYRPLLKEVANSTSFNVILDVKPENLLIILKQAGEVKLLKDYYNYIITCLNTPSKDLLKVLNGSGANLTAIQIITDNSYQLQTVESALLFDSIFLLNDALDALKHLNNGDGQLTIEPPKLFCNESNKYEAGYNISYLMKEKKTIGRTTGPLEFYKNGGGRLFGFKFFEFHNDIAVESGSWENGSLTVMRTQKEREESVTKSIEQRTFKVTTKPGHPYAIEVIDGSTRGILIENRRWEGYSFDLIHAISELLKFKYEFEIVPDEQYGKYSQDTKQWNGLIGRLLNREADMAICDLTITKARESAVDFTMPFMNLGIAILFAKADNKEPELFTFLSPFSPDVWVYMATAYLAVSVMLFIQARMAPGEWDNPHPCTTDPEELENNFDLANSLWLTIGSLMQQGSDILPKAASIRMVAAMWWFFVLIMVSSYTANLAAFLTNAASEATISNVEELAAQSKIKYGMMDGGSTAGFFANSNVSSYSRMWQTMSDAKPSVFTKTNDEGVERVSKGKRTYAYFMESTGIDYAVERDCSLQMVGSLLDNKGYGIAVPPNSPYRTQLSGAILTLQEKGILSQIKEKWWKRGSLNCSKDSTAPASGELTMAHVGGIFLVLFIGCAFAAVLAVFEFIWNVRRVAVDEKITPGEAFMAELKFALNIWAEEKPVKIAQSSKSRSSSSGDGVGGFVRAASTARSMVGSFLRLDSLDNLDKDKDNTPKRTTNNLPL